MTELRVSLIGYGLSGKVFHAPLLKRSGFRVTSIVTRNPERISFARQDLPDAAILDSVEQIWANADAYDLVVVASSNPVHYEHAMGAINAGIPLVVDKPMCATAAEAGELIAAADAKGVAMTSYQNRRWDSEFLTAKALIQSGQLGTVHRVENRFERWRPVPTRSWREATPSREMGGLVYDWGAHTIDQCIELLGPVTSVYCVARAIRDPLLTEDDTIITLRHRDGGVSQIWGTALGSVDSPSLNVFGSIGGYTCPTLDTQEDALRAGLDEPEPQTGTLTVADGTSTTIANIPGNWLQFYLDVAACLRGQGPMPVDPRDTMANLVVIEAALQSAETGEVVHLNSVGHVA